jgi:hypothetical protein
MKEMNREEFEERKADIESSYQSSSDHALHGLLWLLIDLLEENTNLLGDMEAPARDNPIED